MTEKERSFAVSARPRPSQSRGGSSHVTFRGGSDFSNIWQASLITGSLL